MITIVNILLLLYSFEILRNYHIIEVNMSRPVYWKSTVLRLFVGFTVWVSAPFIWRDMTYWQWWGMIPMMLTSFWWIFDYGLNFVRRIRPFYYLNPKGSFLDRFQCNYPNTYVWFWFKLFLMFAGWLVFYYGMDAIWNGVPYIR